MRLTLLTCTAALVAAPAFAADLGTYRPGAPYHSVIVPTANVCESQCDGDAQCRGWNYVKAAPQAPGVCEFQSSVSEPISSAISISGISNTAMPMSSRVIEGNTNTIRIGTAAAPQATQSRQTQTGRQIIREPVPSQYSRGQVPGAYAAPQPGFHASVQGYSGPKPQMTQPAMSRGPARQSPNMRQARPNNVYSAPQPIYGQPYNAQPQMPQSYQGRPPIGQQIAPMPRAQNQAFGQVRAPQMIQGPVQGQAYPAPQAYVQPQSYARPQAYTQPQTYAAPRPYQAQPVTASPMPRSSASNPVSWESLRAQPSQVQPSLYGQLNDDGRQSAPMPTVPSYPTQAVTQMPLAGAQPR